MITKDSSRELTTNLACSELLQHDDCKITPVEKYHAKANMNWKHENDIGPNKNLNVLI